MILGIGTDIVEIERVRKAISEAFMRKVLSKQEMEKALAMSEERRIQFVAGRFAAKEAVIKCLSGYERPVMSDLDIINDEEGKPEIFYKDYRILVSISHERTYATAIALLQESE